MPLEIVALTFVIVAFTAIGARFMAREPDGRARLPALIDRSVGAYLIRRLLGRPTSTRRHHRPRPRISVDRPANIPSGPALIQPTRLVVSSVRRTVEVATPVGTAPRWAPAGRRSSTPRKRPSALVLQRQVAAALAVSVLVLMVIGVALAPRGLQGGVLGATGTPARTAPTATPGRASPQPPPTVSPNAPADSG